MKPFTDDQHIPNVHQFETFMPAKVNKTQKARNSMPYINYRYFNS